MQEINMEWLHFIMLEKMDNLTCFFFFKWDFLGDFQRLCQIHKTVYFGRHYLDRWKKRTEKETL